MSLALMAASCQGFGAARYTEAETLFFSETHTEERIVRAEVPDGALVGLRGAWLHLNLRSNTVDPHPRLEVEVGSPINDMETVDENGRYEFTWRIGDALASCLTGCVFEVPVTISQVEPGRSTLQWSAILEVRTDLQNPELEEMTVTAVEVG